MKNKCTFRRLATAATLLAGFGATTAFGQFAANGTTTVSVNVAAEAAIQITNGTTALTSTGTLFADYTGTTNLTYKIRTGQSSGSGAVTVQITSDFAPAGGPSVATPPGAGDALTYAATIAAPGTAASGNVTASTASATSVATFGADARSAKAGNTGSVAWNLTNDPEYKTGAYNATATFTISAT